MDALKSLLNKQKEDKQKLLGDKKQFSRAELEAAKLKRLREEEELERQEKEKKRKLQEAEQVKAEANQRASKKDGDNQHVEVPNVMPREQVIRRLRALGQPVTLFGEEDFDRVRRLLKAEKELHLEEDDSLGGQQTNSLLEIQRGGKRKKPASGQEDGEKGKDKGKEAKPESVLPEKQLDMTVAVTEADVLAHAFEEAARKVAELQAEQAMSIENRIIKYIQRWCAEWESDMEARPPEVKASGIGKQKWLECQQTQKYFEPLYERLKKNGVDPELKAGIWMIVQAMRERNYLYAYDIYFKIAVGNAPWPIGVTSVGIHERSAREKISHVMNAQGQAHIMNDEATRKFLQAIKRLMTFVQRIHPTDPSRSVDFNAVADESRGSTGRGSDKLALLEAEARGDDWRTLGLAAAPHYIESDGSVKVPPKWQNILKRVDGLGDVSMGAPASPLHQRRSPSPLPGQRATPPRAQTPSSPLLALEAAPPGEGGGK